MQPVVSWTSLSNDGTHQASTHITETPGRKAGNQKRRREEERIKVFENDKCILSFKETWVTCKGCRKIIKLDSRDGARYYPGFWVKHRKRCNGVKDLEKTVR